MFISKKKYKDLILRIEKLEVNYFKDKYEFEIRKLERKYKINIEYSSSWFTCSCYFKIIGKDVEGYVSTSQNIESYEERYNYVINELEKEIRNILWKMERGK